MFDLVTVIGSIVDAIVSEYLVITILLNFYNLQLIVLFTKEKEEIEVTGGKGAVNPYAYAFEGESGPKKVPKKIN